MYRFLKYRDTINVFPSRAALASGELFAKVSLQPESMRAGNFIAPLLVASFLLGGCETMNPAEKRATRYPERFSTLPSRHQDLALRGEVTEGMTSDAVFIAWGRPGRVMSGSREGRGSERWAYFHSTPVSTVSVGYGAYGAHPFYSSFGVHPAYGYGYGPGWGFGSGIDYVPFLERTVEFANGKVVAWEVHR